MAGAEAEALPAPLPAGPLLFAVSIDPSSGVSTAFPVARLVDGGLAPLGLPESPDAGWQARFDSAFMAPGRELELHAAGRRIGSLVLDGATATPLDGCLPVVTGRALVPVGSTVPSRAFAFVSEAGAGGDGPAPYPLGDVDNRVRTFGPILAERLLRERGERRPYLAQRADMQFVSWPGDESPAFAATYLINDELDAPAPPTGQAVSLFFLARYSPEVGYEPVWSEFRRYEDGEGREVPVYVDAAVTPVGRVDFVDVKDGIGIVRIAASVERTGDRQLDWMEAPECRVELLLGAGTGP